jgi:hypothetical protein
VAYPKTGGFLLRGEWAEIHGRNALGDWLAVEDLDGYIRCWLRLVDVETTGVPTGLRELKNPVIVEETKEPGAPACRRDLDEPTCIAAGGTWVDSPLAASYCKCD